MVQGTCGYLDPEYMQTCQLTEKSDVYSFGVVLLEVLTGQEPLKLDGPETQRSLASNFLFSMKENNLDAVLPNHIKGQESAELVRGLAELAKQCLDVWQQQAVHEGSCRRARQIEEALAASFGTARNRGDSKPS